MIVCEWRAGTRRRRTEEREDSKSWRLEELGLSGRGGGVRSRSLMCLGEGGGRELGGGAQRREKTQRAGDSKSWESEEREGNVFSPQTDSLEFWRHFVCIARSGAERRGCLEGVQPPESTGAFVRRSLLRLGVRPLLPGPLPALLIGLLLAVLDLHARLAGVGARRLQRLAA